MQPSKYLEPNLNIHLHRNRLPALHRRLEPVLLHRLHRLLIQPHPDALQHPDMGRIPLIIHPEIHQHIPRHLSLPSLLAKRRLHLVHQHRSANPATNPPRPSASIPANPTPKPAPFPLPNPVPLPFPIDIPTMANSQHQSAAGCSPSSHPSAPQSSAPSQIFGATIGGALGGTICTSANFGGVPLVTGVGPLCPPPPPITCAFGRARRNRKSVSIATFTGADSRTPLRTSTASSNSAATCASTANPVDPKLRPPLTRSTVPNIGTTEPATTQPAHRQPVPKPAPPTQPAPPD